MFYARHDPYTLTKGEHAELRVRARKDVNALKDTSTENKRLRQDAWYNELVKELEQKKRRSINELTTDEEVNEYLERHRWHAFSTQEEANDFLGPQTLYDDPFPGGIGLEAQARFDAKRKSVEDKDYYSKYHVLGRYVGGFKN